jgi:hypothetical protein
LPEEQKKHLIAYADFLLEQSKKQMILKEV